ncbi:MAG: DUF554 domain-containing protein [Treponema sp.]|nr:DUF554 domain-containing protein [Treponema sp.]
MSAVIVNCISIIIGSIVGLLFSKKMSDESLNVIQTAAAAVTIVLGLQMAFQYQSIVYLTLSMIIGGLLGTWWNIDGRILQFGAFLQKLVQCKQVGKAAKTGTSSEVLEHDGATGGPEHDKNFAYAFLNASVLFCVGAMSILGSFKAAIEKDNTLIFTKSILDGFMAISFTVAMGIGTVFSCLAVLVYQGALVLLASFLQPYVSDAMIAELTGCGGVMIVMIGINLLGLRNIKTANYLPALLLEIVFVAAAPFVKTLLGM